MDTNTYNVIFILIMATCFVSTCAGQSTDPLSHESKDRIEEVANTLAGFDEPSHVVLSIDCSGSLDDPQQSAKNAALFFLSLLKNNTKGNIDVGYVAWSRDILIESSDLTSNISKLYQDVNSSVKFGGITCMGRGLNESVRLLRAKEVPGIYNILIIISDGVDNCTSGSNLSCNNVNLLNTTGIYVYTIHVGISSRGTELLKCLENASLIRSPDYRERRTEGFHVLSNLSNDIALKADVINGGYREPYTNMTLLKDVVWGENGPQISLTIKAPSVQDINTEIAISIDSSGSLGWGGRSEYGDNVRRAIPHALESIKKGMNQSKVSIISWDDDIDFAYSPITNKYVSSAHLVPISKAIADVYDNEVFANKIEESNFIIQWLVGFLGIQSIGRYYRCDEDEATNLSLGLDSARAVLNKSEENGKGIRKLIMLITARSEFKPCDPKIIEQAKGEHCDIHTVGIGVVDGSLLEKELKENISSDVEKYHYSPGSRSYDENVMDTIIDDALEQFYAENITEDIIIGETLYPYIFAKNWTIRATLNGTQLNASMDLIKVNQDDSKTWRIRFDRDLRLKPNNILKVTFDTALNMSLPLDATASRTKKRYSLDKETLNSWISYKWLADNQTYSMPLPECRINI